MIRERFNQRIARHHADAKAETIEGGDSPHDIFNLVRSMIMRHEMNG